MTLIAVVSAKGAPGVTTLTVALSALSGPDAVAADLDPYGGDLALRYRRAGGRPLDPSIGLLSLAAAIRSGARSEGTALADHVQRASGGLAILAGVSRPEQVAGLGPLWRHVAGALRSGGTVFADCGRVGPSSAVLPVITTADAVLMVARAELEELAHLRERLRFLAGLIPSMSSSGSRIGVVLINGERDRAAGERAQRLLASAGLSVPVVGRIADDPQGAAVLRGVRAGRPGRTLLVRSARSLLPAVAALTQRVAADDAGLAPQPEPRRPAQPMQPAAHPVPVAQPVAVSAASDSGQPVNGHHPSHQPSHHPSHRAAPDGNG